MTIVSLIDSLDGTVPKLLNKRSNIPLYMTSSFRSV